MIALLTVLTDIVSRAIGATTEGMCPEPTSGESRVTMPQYLDSKSESKVLLDTFSHQSSSLRK